MDKFLELHDHARALESEFKLELDKNETPDGIREKCREFAIEHLAEALSKIAYLVDNGEKDSIQLSAAKTVVQIAQSTTPKDETDPIKRLLEELAT